MTQSLYFILATTVTVGMGIIDSNILLFHGIPWQIKYNTIAIIEYNDRAVYDCFDDPFSVDSVNTALNITPIHIDYIPHLNKIARYNSDTLLSDIYVTSGKSVSHPF